MCEEQGEVTGFQGFGEKEAMDVAGYGRWDAKFLRQKRGDQRPPKLPDMIR